MGTEGEVASLSVHLPFSPFRLWSSGYQSIVLDQGTLNSSGHPNLLSKIVFGTRTSPRYIYQLQPLLILSFYQYYQTTLQRGGGKL